MQSEWKREGKAAGATSRRLRHFMGRRSRDMMPEEEECGKGTRYTALAGNKKGSIFAKPFPQPLTGVGR